MLPFCPQRARFSALALLILLACAAAAVAAEAPSSGGAAGDGVQVEPNLHRDAGTGDTNLGVRGEPIGIVIKGKVQDSSGKALSGARVQLFDGGILVARGTTSSDGEFEISGAPSATEGSSVDLWILSPDATRWVDERIAVVDKTTSKPRPLIASCTPTVTLLGGSASVEVTMSSLDERRMETAKSRCLETPAGG